MAAHLSSANSAHNAPAARHDVFINILLTPDGILLKETSYASTPDTWTAPEVHHPITTAFVVYTANPQASFLAARDQELREPDSTTYQNTAVCNLCSLQLRGM